MVNACPKLHIRIAGSDDVGGMCQILNEIIEIGGTTALEQVLSEDEFVEYFLKCDTYLTCFVAIDGSNFVAGFQALQRHEELPDDWADIATFARVSDRVLGTGRMLFSKTKDFAFAEKITAINATIRADNAGGLRYYNRMGFETYSINRGIPLKNGLEVDRISKRYLMAR